MQRFGMAKASGALANRRTVFCTLALVAMVAMVSTAALVSFAEEPPAKQAASKAPAVTIEQLLKKARKTPPVRLPGPSGKAEIPSSGKTEIPTTLLTDEEARRLTEHFRQQYPFVSLRDRLAYEKHAPKRLKPKVEPHAGKTDLEKDALDDQSTVYSLDFSLRSHALRELHSDNVIDFISREGFGLSRMGTMTNPSFLILPELKPIPFDPAPLLSASHLEKHDLVLVKSEPTRHGLFGKEKLTLEQLEARLPQQYREWVAANNPQQIPTLPRLQDMHKTSLGSFAASSIRVGLVKDIDHVAGFEPHAMEGIPRLNMSKARHSSGYWLTLDRGRADGSDDDQKSNDKANQHLWQVTRLQLVSLLKHDKPGVYLSKNLPSMKELAEVKTRPLDPFEINALEQLDQGKDEVIQPRTNQVRMLGSLRATKRCIECHSVKPGALLGAFSYELTRTKPIPIRSKPVRLN